MKKLIALFLALLLVFTLATVCFADQGITTGDSPVDEGPGEPSDESPVSPDTGIASAAAMLALMFGIAGVAVSGKKLFD